jgi:hypothetical protein
VKTICSLFLAILLSGCASVSAPTTGHRSVVDRLADRFLPPDFQGDARLEQRGQYLTIILNVEGLKRLPSGSWTWSSGQYNRILNIPIFFGVPYRHEGLVQLGDPPER